MVIVMKPNKQLVITKTTRLYQKESIIDSFTFYVPETYQSDSAGSVYDLKEFTASVSYVDPGNNVHSELLTAAETSSKEGFIQYSLPVTTQITAIAGEVKLQLSLVKTDLENGVNIVLHTSELTINILEWSDYFASVSDASLGVIDQKIAELNAQIEALKSIAEGYTGAVPNDLMVTDDLLQLKNDAGSIGAGVKIVIADKDADGESDGVVDVDNLPQVNI